MWILETNSTDPMYFDSLDDLIDEAIEWIDADDLEDEIVSWINELGYNVELPYFGKVPAGKVVKLLAEDEDKWKEIVDDYIEMLRCDIEDSFTSWDGAIEGTYFNWRGFRISQGEEEEDE